MEAVAENGSTFAINERSKGFKWFFAFIMLTTFRKEREKSVLFLLDEPASNLHAKIQEEITQLIIDFSKECQLIYSTHSVYMLDILYINHMFLMINEEEKEAGIPTIKIENAQRNISNSKNRDTHIRPILDALYFSYPRIVPANNSIFVEGFGDFIHLSLFNYIIGKENNLNFIPFTGAGSMKNEIMYLRDKQCKIKILLDDDKNGNDAKANYISYGIEEKDILLHSDINPECKVIEDIYSEKDKKNICDIVSSEKAHDQISKNRLKSSVNAILKDLTKIKDVKLEDQTISKIKNIFEKLAFK